MNLSDYLACSNPSMPIDQDFFDQLLQRHFHHSVNCLEYCKVSNNLFLASSNNITDLPYLSARNFKAHNLLSVPESQIFKVLQSSGTSGNSPSKIFLDKFNARNQSIALSKLFTSYTGLQRPNILIVDSPAVSSRTASFTARKAGILGFSSLCRKSYHALDEKYNIDADQILRSINESDQLLVFGFTSIIWEFFASLSANSKIQFKNKTVLLHGGGWKKLTNLGITDEQFKSKLFQNYKINDVKSYYGMVEQTGSIFFECSHGFYHSNSFASIIPRNQVTLLPELNINVPSLCQVLSVLPTSYPGFSILTDDLISVKHFSDCPCGLKGIAFVVNGRIPTAEIRGCSDTFQP